MPDGIPTRLSEEKMTHEYLLWIATAAYGIHILEEHETNWRDWARNVLKLPVEWTSFYLVNALVVVLGICCAGVGWRLPEFSLAFPALMIINATLFHVLPYLVTRIYSPGLVTALLLFYPVAGWIYSVAAEEGAVTFRSIFVSTLLGALLMASPVVLLKLKSRFVYPPRT